MLNPHPPPLHYHQLFPYTLFSLTIRSAHTEKKKYRNEQTPSQTPTSSVGCWVVVLVILAVVVVVVVVARLKRARKMKGNAAKRGGGERLNAAVGMCFRAQP